MKFKIIPNEQTPAIFYDVAPERLLKEYKLVMVKFLSFASRQTNCAGLAANQVSLDGERVMEKFFAIKVGHFWGIVIRPKILEYCGEKTQKEEGCLTWIGRTIIAERYPEIIVGYYNLRGEEIRRKIDGFEAQVWQHEYNHLMGREEVFK